MTDFVFERDQRKRRSMAFLLLATFVVAGNAWLSRHPVAALIAPGSDAPEWPVLCDLLLVIPLTYLVLFHRGALGSRRG